MMKMHLFFCLLVLVSSPTNGQSPWAALFGSDSESQQNPRSDRHPVILIPGYMGSQLEYQLSRVSVSNQFCPKSTDHMKATLWFDLINFQPWTENCWLENAKLNYNNQSRKSYSDKGVIINPVNFGSTSGIEWISPQPTPQTMYFYNLVNALEAIGYSRDRDILGAPYDWRRAPNENEEFMSGYKSLIEETVKNQNKPVVIMCHSMGCTFSYYFLKQQNPIWIKDNIASLFILAAPLGGTFKYMYGYFGDDDYPASMFPIIRSAERTFSSMAFLLPSKSSFGDQVLVTTPTKKYTANDYEEFFSDLGMLDTLEQFEDVQGLLGGEISRTGLESIKIICIGGTGERTLESAEFSNDLSANQRRRNFKAIYGDGDGFLQTQSMRECLKLNGSDSATRSGDNVQDFVFKEFQLDHMQIIQHPVAINFIIEQLQLINNSNKNKN